MVVDVSVVVGGGGGVDVSVVGGVDVDVVVVSGVVVVTSVKLGDVAAVKRSPLRWQTGAIFKTGKGDGSRGAALVAAGGMRSGRVGH